MNTNKNFYIKLSCSILQLNISDISKIIYAYINGFKYGIFLSINFLCKILNKNKHTIINALRELQQNNLIVNIKNCIGDKEKEVIRNQTEQNEKILFLNINTSSAKNALPIVQKMHYPSAKNALPIVQKMHYPSAKNALQNNIRNTIINKITNIKKEIIIRNFALIEKINNFNEQGNAQNNQTNIFITLENLINYETDINKCNYQDKPKKNNRKQKEKKINYLQESGFNEYESDLFLLWKIFELSKI